MDDVVVDVDEMGKGVILQDARGVGEGSVGLEDVETTLVGLFDY